MVNLMDLVKANKRKEGIYAEGMTGVPTDGKGEEWKENIIAMATRNRVYEQFCHVDTSLVGTKDSIAHIPVQTARYTWLTTAPSNAGTALGVRKWTKMDAVSVVNVEVDATNWYYPGVAIAEYDQESSPINFAKYGRDQMLAAFRDIPEQSIVTAAVTGAGVSALYGGSATSVNNLTVGSILTPDLIINAKSLLRKKGYIPDGIVCAVDQTGALEKDSQFTNASEYGSDEIVRQGFGEIGRYVGLRVFTSDNAPVYASGATDPAENLTWGCAGARAIMFGRNDAGDRPTIASVWKQKESIKTEFNDNAASHLIMGKFGHAAKRLTTNGFVFINTSIM
ncbi:TPA_asm: major capsid protein [Altiarchaeum virus]|nr:TPA_asm: major capsid protein [Altiarchaeum virus]